jgi:hypothetical protein
MKRLIKRFSFFAAAVAAGALVFGSFWSATLQAVTTANGPWCPPNTTNSHAASVSMCVNGKRVDGVTPAQQTTYLQNGTGTCNLSSCPTSGN